ncbi:hypothetical protein [Streptomyces chartreusis]|uniref:Uncharacterized protein n=1 Tax=Streptomyces chartreusis TaxID=1969 RepID=A0A7H8TK11_STRCX|nr:hypothetical protein [Streptomyces chartreusis]QKZ23859.1 hypothetical protein HUT05_44795 [Streptomyces chartreusis]
MVGYVNGLIRNGPFLITHVVPFLLICMGLGSAGWVVVTYGISAKAVPGIVLVGLGLAIAHLGARWRRRHTGATAA